MGVGYLVYLVDVGWNFFVDVILKFWCGGVGVVDFDFGVDFGGVIDFDGEDEEVVVFVEGIGEEFIVGRDGGGVGVVGVEEFEKVFRGGGVDGGRLFC